VGGLPEFPDRYATARQRFREVAGRLGWTVEPFAVEGAGPDGSDLTIDVAQSGPASAARVLVVSSGLHGVEGPFGSAVQTAAMSTLASRGNAERGGAGPAVRSIFIHALNPWGFAWSRRTDAHNVDPNRNFIRPSETWPTGTGVYGRFDRLLNPKRPPSRVSAFPIRMLLALLINGRPVLKQALVTGQYEFPKGLFFGGREPSVTTRFVDGHLPSLVEGARLVLHLDLHTGLGSSASHKLLVDDELPREDRERLVSWFGPEAVEAGRPEGTSYRARGSFARWCAPLTTAGRRYIHACAEFGTYGNLAMLSALRAENQAHHWTAADDPRRARTRARLRNVFIPRSSAWRSRVLADGVKLVDQAFDGLSREESFAIG
jgi:hypothetical protein